VRLDIPMARCPALPQNPLARRVRLIGAARTLVGAPAQPHVAAGLRVSELCLQVADIESAPDRMCPKSARTRAPRPLYAALAATAERLAFVLASLSSASLAVSQPFGHCSH
jgi:hypothetical protein